MRRQRNPRGRLVVRSMDSGRILVGLTEREKWAWADSMILRGEMRRLAQRGCRRISVDLTSVMILPSGFFGMLCEWLEESQGDLHLVNARPEVQRTLWFQLFADKLTDGTFRVLLEPRRQHPAFVDEFAPEEIGV